MHVAVWQPSVSWQGLGLGLGVGLGVEKAFFGKGGREGFGLAAVGAESGGVMARFDGFGFGAGLEGFGLDAAVAGSVGKYTFWLA